jgi:hypothetical protein
MRSGLRSKLRLWWVLSLTVGAAIAIVAGISSQVTFPAKGIFAAKGISLRSDSFPSPECHGIYSTPVSRAPI